MFLKTMRTLTLLAMLCMAQATLSPLFAQSKTVHHNKKRVEVLFTSQMTQFDLDAIVAQMKKKDIRLKISKTKYDATGHLQSLRIDVNCKDGFSGGAEAQLSGQRFGFIRDYKNKSVPFQVGNI
jgi:hypothetical protein